MRNSRRLKQARREARRLGVSVPRHIPVGTAPDEYAFRSEREVASRSLALDCVNSTAFGLSKEKAALWLTRHDLTSFLTQEETRFLQTPDVPRKELEAVFAGRPASAEGNAIRVRIEALWALAWALGLVQAVSWDRYCADYLTSLFPDHRGDPDPADFYERAQLRSKEEILLQADIAVCLHWAVHEAGLGRRAYPFSVRAYVIEQRRRALNWILSDAPWDEVPMDT